MIILLIISIITIFIFAFRDYSIISKKLKRLYKNKISNKKEEFIDNKKKNKQKNNKITLNLNNNKQIRIKNLTKSLNNISNPVQNKKNIKPSINATSKNDQYNMNSLSITNKILNSNNIFNISISNNKSKMKQKIKVPYENLIKKNEICSYNDYEINNLDYLKAIMYDNRTYCQYYLSLIKIKHIFIFTFFYDEDYNSKIIKIYIFIFNFLVDYTT